MWIALGVIAVLVTLAFALVGAPHLFRTTPVARVVDLCGDDPDAALSAATLPGLARLTVQTVLRPGATAELLNDGDGTFPRLWDDMRNARTSITMVSYFGMPGALTDTMAEILAERARAGVDVCWVHDAVGSGKLGERYFQRLREAGVRTATFRPVRWYTLDRANNRTHVRSVVIDGRIGYTGGFGFDDRWLGDGRSRNNWRDCNVRLTGPVVAELQAAFTTHWAEAANELVLGQPSTPGPDNHAAGAAALPLELAGVLNSGGTTGSSAAERLLAMTIATARSSLLITNAYFVPDDDFIDLLIGAKERGVDVRVLTNGPRIDVKLALLAGRRRYERLLDAGIHVFEYQPALLHAKTIVADGAWCVVGTINFDNRSLAFNNEISLIARDAALGRALEDQFAADLRHSAAIDPDRFRQRSVRHRLMERAADLLWRWI